MFGYKKIYVRDIFMQRRFDSKKMFIIIWDRSDLEVNYDGRFIETAEWAWMI